MASERIRREKKEQVISPRRIPNPNHHPCSESPDEAPQLDLQGAPPAVRLGFGRQPAAQRALAGAHSFTPSSVKVKGRRQNFKRRKLHLVT